MEWDYQQLGSGRHKFTFHSPWAEVGLDDPDFRYSFIVDIQEISNKFIIVCEEFGRSIDLYGRNSVGILFDSQQLATDRMWQVIHRTLHMWRTGFYEHI